MFDRKHTILIAS